MSAGVASGYDAGTQSRVSALFYRDHYSARRIRGDADDIICLSDSREPMKYENKGGSFESFVISGFSGYCVALFGVGSICVRCDDLTVNIHKII